MVEILEKVKSSVENSSAPPVYSLFTPLIPIRLAVQDMILAFSPNPIRSWPAAAWPVSQKATQSMCIPVICDSGMMTSVLDRLIQIIAITICHIYETNERQVRRMVIILGGLIIP